MEYAQADAAASQMVAGSALGQINAVKPPHLADLAAYADRIEKAAAVVREFNDRYRPLPQLACGNEAKVGNPSGYAGEMSRINRALGSLESAVAHLTNIG